MLSFFCIYSAALAVHCTLGCGYRRTLFYFCATLHLCFSFRYPLFSLPLCSAPLFSVVFSLLAGAFCPSRSLGVTELSVLLSVPPVCIGTVSIGTVSNACVAARLEYVWRCVCARSECLCGRVGTGKWAR